jgi:hypothetical protein
VLIHRGLSGSMEIQDDPRQRSSSRRKAGRT